MGASERSGGFSGPSWGDFWLSVADVEKQLRCRCVVRLGGSKFVKTGCAAEVLLMRYLTRTSHQVIAHVDGYWPNKRFATMPALLIALLYMALEEGMQFDARPHRQLEVEDLPLPPTEET